MIQYNTPILINDYVKYKFLMNKFAGIICGRIDSNNQCWIKVWLMKYKKQIEQYL